MALCRNSHLPTLTYHMDKLQYKLCLLLQHQTFSIYKHCFFQSSISIRLLSSLFRIGVQSQQQVVFFLNQYKMEPIVLYQSYSSFRVLYQLRLLSSEPCSSRLFPITRKVFFCLLCRGANKTFQFNTLSLLVKILKVQGGHLPPCPSLPPSLPPSAPDCEIYINFVPFTIGEIKRLFQNS